MAKQWYRIGVEGQGPVTPHRVRLNYFAAAGLLGDALDLVLNVARRRPIVGTFRSGLRSPEAVAADVRDDVAAEEELYG